MNLVHLLLPHESNNQKAKILHSSSLLLIAYFLVLGQIALTIFPHIGPQVLGFAANIAPDEVVRLTNEERVKDGLLPLKVSDELTRAAQAKGADMLTKGYWAHNSPDGTAPWKFFTDAGYSYRFAGENLARDFSNPTGTVEAWMASSSHRENLLSDKYKEIGIAVVEGKLAGVETTIVIQLFGTRYGDTLAPVPLASSSKTTIPQTSNVQAVSQERSAPPLISPFTTTKSVSFGIVALLLGVLVLDGVVTAKRGVVRIGGRTFAHMAFLGMVMAIVILLKAGQII